MDSEQAEADLLRALKHGDQLAAQIIGTVELAVTQRVAVMDTHQPSEFLSLEAMKRDQWNAVNLPLPATPSPELVREAHWRAEYCYEAAAHRVENPTWPGSMAAEPLRWPMEDGTTPDLAAARALARLIELEKIGPTLERTGPRSHPDQFMDDRPLDAAGIAPDSLGKSDSLAEKVERTALPPPSPDKVDFTAAAQEAGRQVLGPTARVAVVVDGPTVAHQPNYAALTAETLAAVAGHKAAIEQSGGNEQPEQIAQAMTGTDATARAPAEPSNDDLKPLIPQATPYKVVGVGVGPEGTILTSRLENRSAPPAPHGDKGADEKAFQRRLADEDSKKTHAEEDARRGIAASPAERGGGEDWRARLDAKVKAAKDAKAEALGMDAGDGQDQSAGRSFRDAGRGMTR